MAPTPEATRAGYHTLWSRAKIRDETKVGAASIAKKAISNKAKYQEIEKKTGVPWPMTAALHNRESSMSFAGVLHNGERILGTGRKTTLVPKGRGPFPSADQGGWEIAAIDALNMPPHSLNKVPLWSVERILYECEKYNGWGYTNRKINSPYVWAWTSEQQRGKFIADGRFDPNVLDLQAGCAAVLKALSGVDADAASKLARREVSPPADVIRNETTKERSIRNGGLATAGAGGVGEASNATTQQPDKAPVLSPMITYTLIAVGVVVFVVAAILIARKVKAVKENWV